MAIETLDFIENIRELLPTTNELALTGEISISSWMTSIGSLVAAGPMIPERGTELSKLFRLAVLITAQSTARLEQVHDLEPGSMLASMPELVELVELVDPEGVGLTAERYWLDNSTAKPMTFSTCSGEKWFIRAVRWQTTHTVAFNEKLRPICAETSPVAGIDTLRALESAASDMFTIQVLYRDFHRGPDGAPMITPAMFNQMRNWLQPMWVKGKEYAAPNAAFIAQMVSPDLLMGATGPRHRQYMDTFKHLIEESSVWQLEKDASMPTIIEVFALALGYEDTHELEDAPTLEIVERAMQTPGLAKTMAALSLAHAKYVGASGAHLGLVIKMLVRYDEGLDDAARAKMGVKPDTGVGGNGVEHLRRLHNTRRDIPGFGALQRVLKHLAANQPAPTT